jgi:hypothetical protein
MAQLKIRLIALIDIFLKKIKIKIILMIKIIKQLIIKIIKLIKN